MKIYLTLTMMVVLINSALSQVNINVTTTDKKQTIVGLGANIGCDSILLTDIGASMVRMGRDEADVEAINDNGDPFTLDLTKFGLINANTVNKLKAFMSRGVKVIIVISTPPIWMKDTNSSKMYWRMLQAQGKPASEINAYKYRYECGGELRSDMYAEFGEFVAGIVLKFKEQTGYDLYSICPQNEPEFSEPYWSCVYNSNQMLNTTNAIGALFDLHNIKTRINFADQCFPQNNIYTWSHNCNNNDSCKKYVSGFSTHDYSDDPMGGGMSTPFKWAVVYTESKRVTPVKETWMTEGGPGYNSAKTPIQISVGGAQQYYYSMRYGNTSVFLAHVFSAKAEDVIEAGSMKNMFRFVRPGSYRVTAIPASDTLNVQPLVFINDAQGSTTVVVNNKDVVEKKIKINGISGVYDIFRTTQDYACNWVGAADLTNEITLPPMSISTLVKCSINKLPNITIPDTFFVIKNAPEKSYNLTGIDDGGEGNQLVSITANSYLTGSQIFSKITTTYTSPNTTGKINLTPKTDQTGMTYISIAVRDNSKAMDSMFNEKIVSVPAFVIPYINKPPTLNDIDDQVYGKEKINSQQLLMLANVTDGNDGKQKLTITATVSAPWIATVTPQGKSLQILPKAEGTVTVTITITDDGVNVGGGSGSITQSFKIIIGSGINSIERPEENAVIYPNPVKDRLTIENKGQQFDQVEIISLDGVALRSLKIQEYKTTINLDGILPGFYLVRLTGKCKTLISRIAIE